ncbi:MAG: PQQ-dependent sugar dehydrogenase [Verrucomicrobiota bacterium]
MILLCVLFRSALFSFVCLGTFACLLCQNASGRGKVRTLYEANCQVCHGAELNNGLGGSLLDDWDHVTSKRTVELIIKNGLPQFGMTAFGGALSGPEIRSLAIYIDEMRLKASNAGMQWPQERSATFRTKHHAFKIEELCASDREIFWAIDFLPGNRVILTQFGGGLRIFENGMLGPPIKNTPKVWRHGQGGLMDVGVHPDYEENGWIYLSYADELAEKIGSTTVARGRIKDGTWVDNEVLFRVDPKFSGRKGAHFGSRFVFDQGYLFFGIGDRGQQNQAQDLSFPNGKIHRIFDDGRVPKDNPFVDRSDAYPTIWSYGNRNPQGLAKHPVTGALWETEHGPRGGDEVNVIRKGKNYGWPVITYGMNYNGTPITSETKKDGMEQPVTHYTPSIAICGMAFYQGKKFENWHDDLFVGGLAAQELWRIRLDGEKVVEREIVLKGQGRIRDIALGPNESLYLLLNKGKRKGESQLVRLVPVSGP